MKRSEVDALVKAVAIEHSRVPSAGSCLCSHVRGVHHDGWGPCQGRVRGSRCSCTSFQGVNWASVQRLRVFGQALLARLKQQKQKKKNKY